jgi:uncharacterized FlaG/YvyC family protein
MPAVGEPKVILTNEWISSPAKSSRHVDAAVTAAVNESKQTKVRPDDKVEPTQVIDDFAKLREQLKTMAEALPAGSSLVIDRDGESGRFVYRFVDPENGEVLRQFPADDMLKRAAALRDLTGAVVDDKA